MAEMPVWLVMVVGIGSIVAIAISAIMSILWLWRWLAGQRVFTLIIGGIALAGIILIATAGFAAYAQWSGWAPQSERPIQASNSKFVDVIEFRIAPYTTGNSESVAQATLRVNGNYPRLRVRLQFESSNDVAVRKSVWQRTRTIDLDDLRDVAKDDEVSITFVRKMNGTEDGIIWGNPERPAPSDIQQITRSRNRARLRITGPDDREQAINILIYRVPYDALNVGMTGKPVLAIIDDDEIKRAFSWD